MIKFTELQYKVYLSMNLHIIICFKNFLEFNISRLNLVYIWIWDLIYNNFIAKISNKNGNRLFSLAITNTMNKTMAMCHYHFVFFLSFSKIQSNK